MDPTKSCLQSCQVLPENHRVLRRLRVRNTSLYKLRRPDDRLLYVAQSNLAVEWNNIKYDGKRGTPYFSSSRRDYSLEISFVPALSVISLDGMPSVNVVFRGD